MGVRLQRIADGAMPWSGLALGTLGFAVAHQLGADSSFENCVTGSPWSIVGGGVLGLLLIAAGALGSWSVAAAEGEGPARRLIAIVSVMATALFALFIVLTLAAAMIIPPCFA
jgi:hypothetical protein